MRFYIVSLVAFLNACSDYRFADVDKDDGLEDLFGIDQAPECSFREHNGKWQTRGVGGNSDPVYVSVSTLPVFTLRSPDSVTVHSGQEVILEFTISAHHGCGGIDLNHFFFVVHDDAADAHEWLQLINDEAVLAYFQALDSQVVFPAYAAENMALTPTGKQLFYVWKNVASIEFYGAAIDTQRLDALEERTFRFTWTASDYVPLGQTFRIYLTRVGWTDLATGTQVYSDAEPYFQGIKIEVTVAE